MVKKKIGIVTWHYYTNFGSALQAFALQKVISELKYDVSIINYRNIKFGKINPWKVQLQYFLDKSIGKVWCRLRYPYVSFQKDFFRETELTQNEGTFEKICNKFDVIVCGSDQIWAPNVLNPVYMLNGVSRNVCKMSYAASIGLNSIPAELVFTYRKLLGEFKMVSVREEQGAELLKKDCSIESKVVLDPTLLIDTDIWKSMEKKPQKNEKGKYVFCYFLNEKHAYKGQVHCFASMHGMKTVGYTANNNDQEWMDYIYKRIGPCEFLWLIHHAEYVITDSYHGTIFSLLYHKKFITLERFSNVDDQCQNSRIYQLKKHFDLEQQIISCGEYKELPQVTIDYIEFEHKLQILRKDSYDFLRYALEE